MDLDPKLLGEFTKHLVPRDCEFIYLEAIARTIREALVAKMPVAITEAEVQEKWKGGEIEVNVYTVDGEIFRSWITERYKGYCERYDDLLIAHFGADQRARKIILDTLEAGYQAFLIPNPWFGDGDLYSIIHREYDNS